MAKNTIKENDSTISQLTLLIRLEKKSMNSFFPDSIVQNTDETRHLVSILDDSGGLSSYAKS